RSTESGHLPAHYNVAHDPITWVCDLRGEHARHVVVRRPNSASRNPRIRPRASTTTPSDGVVDPRMARARTPCDGVVVTHVARDGGAMGKLIYSTIGSLDGYTADEHGDFQWAAPDAEVHAFVNDLERPVGTYLYGRKMYETMVYWETEP